MSRVRDTALVSDLLLPGAEPRARDVAALTSSLIAGERVVCAAAATEIESDSRLLGAGTAVLTSKRLLASRGRAFGRATADLAFDLDGCTGSRSRPAGDELWVRFATRNLVLLTFPERGLAEAFDRRLLSVVNPTREHRTRLGRLHDFGDELAPMATRPMLGEPFGEDMGLDEAVDLLADHLASMQEMRRFGELMITELVMVLGDHQMARDTSAIMGATAEVARARRLTEDQEYAVRGLGNAARMMLAQFITGGETYDEWLEDDDAAIVLLCWHMVARLRQATAGMAPPFTRPTWADPPTRRAQT
jgi:hypothetical protein